MLFNLSSVATRALKLNLAHLKSSFSLAGALTVTCFKLATKDLKLIDLLTYAMGAQVASLQLFHWLRLLTKPIRAPLTRNQHLERPLVDVKPAQAREEERNKANNQVHLLC